MRASKRRRAASAFSRRIERSARGLARAPAARLGPAVAAPGCAKRGRAPGSLQRYFAGPLGVVLFCVEPKGAAGAVGFFDCFGFFFSLLLRS